MSSIKENISSNSFSSIYTEYEPQEKEFEEALNKWFIGKISYDELIKKYPKRKPIIIEFIQQFFSKVDLI